MHHTWDMNLTLRKYPKTDTLPANRWVPNIDPICKPNYVNFNRFILKTHAKIFNITVSQLELTGFFSFLLSELFWPDPASQRGGWIGKKEKAPNLQHENERKSVYFSQTNGNVSLQNTVWKWEANKNALMGRTSWYSFEYKNAFQ